MRVLRATKWVLPVLAATLALIAVADDPIKAAFRGTRELDSIQTSELIMRICIGATSALLMAVVACTAARARNRRGLLSDWDRQPMRTIAVQPPDSLHRFDATWSALEEVRKRYRAESIALFCVMLVDPSYRHRVCESITIESGFALKSVQTEYIMTARDIDGVRGLQDGVGDQIPDPRILIPLIYRTKDAVAPSVDVTDQSGRPAIALPSQTTYGLVSVAIRSYLHLAFFGVEDSEGELTVEARQALWEIRALLSPSSIVPYKEVVDKFDLATSALIRKDEKVYAQMRAFCAYFGENTVVVYEAAVPDGPSVTLTAAYEYSFYLSSPLPWLRRLLGMESEVYVFDLNPLWLSSDYVLEIRRPGVAQFVCAQRLIVPRTGDRLEDTSQFTGRLTYESDLHRVAARVRLQGIGQHEDVISWRVRLLEVPPGAHLPVLGLSLSATVVALAFGIVAPGIGDGDGFDASSLVLGLPLFLLTFSGFSLKKLSRSSMVATLSFVVSTLLVFTSALTVLVAATARPLLIDSLTIFGGTSVPAFNWLLVLCAAISLLLSTQVGAVMYLRIGLYRRVAHRDEDRTAH